MVNILLFHFFVKVVFKMKCKSMEIGVVEGATALILGNKNHILNL